MSDTADKSPIATLTKNLTKDLTISPTAAPPSNGSPNTAAAASASAATNAPQDGEVDETDASHIRKMLRSTLVETNTTVEIEQKNPESPLYSAKSFEELELRPELLQGIYAMGFTKPSKIQETALPALIMNPPQNLIAQSQSGTGKTAAFTLAMLSRIDTNLKYPQAICLAPTMELAAQTADVIQRMGQFMPDLTIALGIKGQSVQRNVALQNQIIIGTPGTVLDWSTKLNVVDLKKVRAFVLDEADVMIAQQGHQDFCARIVRALPRECQMMLFSATYNNTVMEFATKVVRDAMIIRLRRQEESLNYIQQFYVICDSDQTKYRVLMDVYGLLTVGQAIIFCQRRQTAGDLAVQLHTDGISAELLSGELDVNQRAAVIERFRAGKAKMLVTTNVTARGIDVEEVDFVMNYDLPVDQQGNPDYETYLHRIGRTGRFGKPGIAINLLFSSAIPTLEKIQKHFGRDIKRLDADDQEQIAAITK